MVDESELEDFIDQTWTDEDARKHPGLNDAYATMMIGIADDLPMSTWHILIEMRYQDVPEEVQERDRVIETFPRTRITKSDSLEPDAEGTNSKHTSANSNGKRPVEFTAGEAGSSKRRRLTLEHDHMSLPNTMHLQGTGVSEKAITNPTMSSDDNVTIGSSGSGKMRIDSLPSSRNSRPSPISTTFKSQDHHSGPSTSEGSAAQSRVHEHPTNWM